MKRYPIFSANAPLRNLALTAALIAGILGASSGCAIFNKKSDGNAKINEFEEDAAETGSGKDSEDNFFDSERKKQSDMSDFVSSFGRKSKSKKDVDPGQTFLMSDKAKEIYANTER